MTRRVRFAPEAEAELKNAARWYERRNAGLGLTFLEAVDEVAGQILQWPQAGTIIPSVKAERTARRRRVRRFPYHVVWVVTGDEIYVAAVAHNRRQPGYWSERVEGL